MPRRRIATQSRLARFSRRGRYTSTREPIAQGVAPGALAGCPPPPPPPPPSSGYFQSSGCLAAEEFPRARGVAMRGTFLAVGRWTAVNENSRSSASPLAA